MATYIKSNIPGFFTEFQNPLDPSIYNNIGTSWDDFLSGKWVELSKEQKDFLKTNPGASPKEVFFLKIETYSEDSLDIDDYKDRKEKEIWGYDQSNNVNLAYLNGKEVWFSKEERQSLKMRLDAEKSMKKKRTNIWYKNELFVMNITDAVTFLAKLENYAAECFDNTKKHIYLMRKLTDIDSIASYEYKTGYPEKLNLKYA